MNTINSLLHAMAAALYSLGGVKNTSILTDFNYTSDVTTTGDSTAYQELPLRYLIAQI